MNSKMGLKNERQDSQITIFARARLKDELSFEKKARGRRHHIRVYNTGILLATSYPNQAQNIDKFMTRCDQAMLVHIN